MYAAYTAALNLNHNLVEMLEIPESRSSTWKEAPSSGQTSVRNTHLNPQWPCLLFQSFGKSVQGSSSRRNVEFLDELEEFPEYLEMMNSRKKVCEYYEKQPEQSPFFGYCVEI